MPITNCVQSLGRSAPRATITSKIGMSRKCVNDASCSARAWASSGVIRPTTIAARAKRRNLMKYSRVIVLPSMNSKAEQDHHADKPRGIEEHPRHEESEDENETAVGAGLDRDPRPFVALEKFGIFLFFGPICDCPSASSIDLSQKLPQKLRFWRRAGRWQPRFNAREQSKSAGPISSMIHSKPNMPPRARSSSESKIAAFSIPIAPDERRDCH
jgi:hypothetical protein